MEMKDYDSMINLSTKDGKRTLIFHQTSADEFKLNDKYKITVEKITT